MPITPPNYKAVAGEWTAASKDDVPLYNCEKEPGRTTEEMDRKHEARHTHHKKTIYLEEAQSSGNV